MLDTERTAENKTDNILIHILMELTWIVNTHKKIYTGHLAKMEA